MYKYQVIVGSSHPFGLDFIENLVSLTSQGAVLDKNAFNSHNANFPARAYMILESETVRENTATIRYVLIEGAYTREQLDAMKWDDLKNVCKAVGITGRDRELITNSYLEAVSK